MKLLSGGIIIFALFSSFQPVSVVDRHKEKFKQEFLTQINKIRASGCHCGTTYEPPVPPLVWNDQLAKAAEEHAGDMFTKDYFGHRSKDGRTPSDRVIAAGYGYKGYRSYAVGENIAQGQKSITEVMTGWIKSPEHCKNLMNPLFREVGVAQFYSYWVQDFGGRIPFSARQKRLIKNGRLKVIEDKP